MPKRKPPDPREQARELFNVRLLLADNILDATIPSWEIPRLHKLYHAAGIQLNAALEQCVTPLERAPGRGIKAHGSAAEDRRSSRYIKRHWSTSELSRAAEVIGLASGTSGGGSEPQADGQLDLWNSPQGGG